MPSVLRQSVMHTRAELEAKIEHGFQQLKDGLDKLMQLERELREYRDCLERGLLSLLPNDTIFYERNGSQAEAKVVAVDFERLELFTSTAELLPLAAVKRFSRARQP
jgi:hypothetical protein